MDEAATEVILTTWFRQRLLDIEAFLESADAGQAFDRLIDAVHGVVIPNLRRFPRMGRPYAKRAYLTVEAHSPLRGVSDPRVEALREYLHGDYLILYAFPTSGHTVYLLSIRHHRQLSFDLPG